MTSNQRLLEKADLSIADLAADGGLLNPEQSNTFVRKLIESPTVLQRARVVEMSAPERHIDKIFFASRIMRAAVPNTALDEADRSKPTTEQVVLTSKEVMGEVRLPYDVIEDNIERGNIGQQVDGSGTSGTPAGGGIIDTVLAGIADRVAVDFEQFALLGDTSSSDDYLALTDGWLETTRDGGNVVNHSGATMDRSLFKDGLMTMPDQYLVNRAGMYHMVSFDNEIEYRDTLASRATGLGDSMIQSNTPVFGFGVPILPVMTMPNDRGLFCNPLNLLFGIQRRLHLEYEKLIGERVWRVVITARIDSQVEETDAAVYYSNIADPTG